MLVVQNLTSKTFQDMPSGLSTEMPEELRTLQEEQALGVSSDVGLLPKIAALAKIDNMHCLSMTCLQTFKRLHFQVILSSQAGEA